jgi:hypothetical protein
MAFGEISMQTNSFTQIHPWIKEILTEIKKEIKTDHLQNDPVFCRAHFGNRPIQKLTMDEILHVYEKELLSGNEPLSEWVVNRWVFKHGEVYKFFVERLSSINPEFQEITSLTEAEADQVLSGADALFGDEAVYLFSKLNRVVFPDAIFQRLFIAAQTAQKKNAHIKETQQEQESYEKLIERQEREMSRLKEKYEDKLAGVQRKYATDVEALKKQIRALQQAKK